MSDEKEARTRARPPPRAPRTIAHAALVVSRPAATGRKGLFTCGGGGLAHVGCLLALALWEGKR